MSRNPRRSPDSSVFHVGIVGEDGKIIQEGSLEATPSSLVYTEEVSLSKFSWPIQNLKKFEAQGDDLFVIEASKLCQSGVGQYIFSTPNAKQIQAIVSRNVSTLAQTSTTQVSPPSPSNYTFVTSSPSLSESSPIHWKLNTSLSTNSSFNHTPNHSRSPSFTKDNVFEVERIVGDFRTCDPGTIEVVNSEVIYTDNVSGRRLEWPIAYLRRYGHENNVFTIEIGRRCAGGPGMFTFRTPKASEMNAAIKAVLSNTAHPSSPTEVKKQKQPLPPLPSPLRNGPLSHPPQHRAPLPPPSNTPLSSSHPPSSQPPLPPIPTASPLSTSFSHPPPLQSPLPLPPFSHGSTPPPSAGGHTRSSPQREHNTRHDSSHFSPPHIGHSKQFSRKDSLMRRAFSAMDLRKNVFEVRNISDEQKEVGQGTVEVTNTDLIYVDSRTNEKWKWPFKFMRKYGYERNIFSFEAGRRCAGGQGLYAFASEQANEIHEAIVENIHGQKLLNAPSKGGLNSSSNPRLSLAVDKMSIPPIRLSGRNHYIDSGGSTSTPHDKVFPTNRNSSGSGFNIGTPPPPPSPSSKPTPSGVKTRSCRSESSPITDGVVIRSPDSVSTSSGSSSRSSLGVFSPVPKPDVRNPSSQPATTPEYSVIKVKKDKPVTEPDKPVLHREHFYDVPSNYAQGHTGSSESSQGNTNATTNGDALTNDQTQDNENPSSTRIGASNGLELVEKPKTSSSDNKTEAVTNEERNSISSNGLGESFSQDSKGGRNSKKSKEKKTNPLSRWIGRTKSSSEEKSERSKKSKKKRGKPNSKKDGKAAKEEGNDSMYENLREANLSKMKYSASCDDLLNSCNETTQSSVPQPSNVRLTMTPPATRSRPLSNYNEPPSSSLYENLQKVKNSISTSMDMEKGVPDKTTPPSDTAPVVDEQINSPRLYSNINVSEDQDPRLMSETAKSEPNSTPTKPSIMSYAELEIINTPPPSAIAIESKRTAWSVSGSKMMHQNQNPSESESSAAGDGFVQYAPLDFRAMSAVEQIKKQHNDISTFEGLLERHDIRDMEMDNRRRRNNT